VKRFTPPSATRIANLIPGDVIRPIIDIVSNLGYEDLVSDVTQVIKTLVYRERQVQPKDQSWYIMRIHPYRTTESVSDGVVLTFTGITALKDLEKTLRNQGGEGSFRRVLDHWPGCVYIYDLAGGMNVCGNRSRCSASWRTSRGGGRPACAHPPAGGAQGLIRDVNLAGTELLA